MKLINRYAQTHYNQYNYSILYGEHNVTIPIVFLWVFCLFVILMGFMGTLGSRGYPINADTLLKHLQNLNKIIGGIHD